jgi:hypothetical protein
VTGLRESGSDSSRIEPIRILVRRMHRQEGLICSMRIVKLPKISLFEPLGGVGQTRSGGFSCLQMSCRRHWRQSLKGGLFTASPDCWQWECLKRLQIPGHRGRHSMSCCERSNQREMFRKKSSSIWANCLSSDSTGCGGVRGVFSLCVGWLIAFSGWHLREEFD